MNHFQNLLILQLWHPFWHFLEKEKRSLETLFVFSFSEKFSKMGGKASKLEDFKKDKDWDAFEQKLVDDVTESKSFE